MTVHANNPDACIARLDNLILQAGFELPSRAIRELIAEAVDIIVQISRLNDGSRKITHIAHVSHYDHEKATVITKNIFHWKLTGVIDKKLQGEFEYTGYQPPEDFLAKFERHGTDFYQLINGEEE